MQNFLQEFWYDSREVKKHCHRIILRQRLNKSILVKWTLTQAIILRINLHMKKVTKTSKLFNQAAQSQFFDYCSHFKVIFVIEEKISSTHAMTVIVK